VFTSAASGSAIFVNFLRRYCAGRGPKRKTQEDRYDTPSHTLGGRVREQTTFNGLSDLANGDAFRLRLPE
jgi:hypothetical protein